MNAILFGFFGCNCCSLLVITTVFRRESKSARFFHIWAVAFNIIVVSTALYGVYKERAPLLIPFLAYRTVNFIFYIFPLMNARAIASTLNETIESSTNNERDETFDTLPLVIIVILAIMGWEFYCLLIVFSFYKMQMRKIALIAALTVPVISYSTLPHDNLNMYMQPAVNPYMFESKHPYLYQETYPAPPGSVQHSGGYNPGMMYTGNYEMPHHSQPPPYRP